MIDVKEEESKLEMHSSDANFKSLTDEDESHCDEAE